MQLQLGVGASREGFEEANVQLVINIVMVDEQRRIEQSDISGPDLRSEPWASKHGGHKAVLGDGAN